MELNVNMSTPYVWITVFNIRVVHNAVLMWFNNISSCVIGFCMSVELNYSVPAAQNIETFELTWLLLSGFYFGVNKEAIEISV
jgi:hypothetical protein